MLDAPIMATSPVVRENTGHWVTEAKGTTAPVGQRSPENAPSPGAVGPKREVAGGHRPERREHVAPRARDEL